MNFTQIQIGFAAIVENEHFAMLEGRHSAGINVEVGVDLDGCNAVAGLLDTRMD